MIVKISGKEVDRLTQAQANLYSCTYLLQLIEEKAVVSQEFLPKMLVDACARAYLYEAQMRELDVMRDVFDRISFIHPEAMWGKQNG